MKEHQTVQIITPGQMKDLASALTQAIPNNLSFAQAEHWLKKKKELGNKVRGLLYGDPDFPLIKSQWEKFYQEVFNKKIDFSDVPVPEASGEYSWLIMNHPEITLEDLHSGGKDPQPHWKYTDKKLDEVLDWTFGCDAMAQKEPYIIRVRPNQEADEDLKDKSANDITQAKINTLTLKERLALGRFLYWSENIILDKKVVTLCSGSRYSVGRVPGVPLVGWDDDGVGVSWYRPDFAFGTLRPRKAVSLPF